MKAPPTVIRAHMLSTKPMMPVKIIPPNISFTISSNRSHSFNTKPFFILLSILNLITYFSFCLQSYEKFLFLQNKSIFFYWSVITLSILMSSRRVWRPLYDLAMKLILQRLMCSAGLKSLGLSNALLSISIFMVPR